MILKSGWPSRGCFIIGTFSIKPVPHPYNDVAHLHSQFMTKLQVGHDDKSWSNLGRLIFDQDFMS